MNLIKLIDKNYKSQITVMILAEVTTVHPKRKTAQLRRGPELKFHVFLPPPRRFYRTAGVFLSVSLSVNKINQLQVQ